MAKRFVRVKVLQELFKIYAKRLFCCCKVLERDVMLRESSGTTHGPCRGAFFQYIECLHVTVPAFGFEQLVQRKNSRVREILTCYIYQCLQRDWNSLARDKSPLALWSSVVVFDTAEG